MSLWIKICANTSLEDALLAAESGADAAGFVFAPSPRRVTPQQVAAIVPHLPAALEKIGVFVDSPFDPIAATVETAGLTGVQLHFDAPLNLSTQLRARFGPSLRILRVVHFDAEKAAGLPGPDSSHESLAASASDLVSGHNFSRAGNAKRNEGALAPEGIFSDPNTDAILVDSLSTKAPGGTGKSFDWSLAADTLFQKVKQRKLVAAGGLTPDNVAQAIAILRPWGADVVSGVESVPGRKDAAKVRAFVANARAAHGVTSRPH